MSTASAPKALPEDRSQRIVAAMRACVGEHGVAGATFDRVAREAGVSRGLLHYHFGTKEQLLAEALRHDCAVRMEALEAALAGARTRDDVLDVLVSSLEDMVERDPAFVAGLFELFGVARRNQDIAVELAALSRGVREHFAGLLARAQDDGVLALGAEPDAVATVLFALADGLCFRLLSEPGADMGGTIAAARRAAGELVRSAV
jgi:AcrR family transcriptional regulator